MKKPEAFYPPLAAAFPILAVFSANLSLCPLENLWRPLGVAVVSGLAVWLVAGAICRSLSRGAAAATVIIALSFCYAALSPRVTSLGIEPIYCWGAITLALAALAAWKWRWHKLLNVVAVCLVLSSVGSIIFGYSRIAADESRMAHMATQKGQSIAARPDIYYIILDGYGRADQLQRVMHYDDAPFLAELGRRGFWVAPESHSNYVQTELSLPSSLNMAFIPTLLPSQSRSSDDRTPLDDLASNNMVAGYLRGLGYEYVAITSGFPSLQFDGADLKLGAAHKISLLESALLAMTPFGDQGDVMDSQFEERRQLLTAAFDNVKSVATSTHVKPRFVFVHVLAPHPPFVFNADGTPRRRTHGAFGYWDGSDYMKLGLTQEDYRQGYVAQLQYVNQRTLDVIDTIQRQAGPPALILLQGDHGSKLGLDQDSLAKTDIVEAMSNLMAYNVPDTVKAKLYPTITPVNSFRIILSTLFGADYPNLPDQSWYSAFDRPYDFQEVTNRLTPNRAK